MTMTKKGYGYNGWTNYATWRCNLELLGDYQYDEEELKNLDVDYLKEMVDNYVFERYSGNMGLVEDYARAFLNDVNYYEILDGILDSYGINKKF